TAVASELGTGTGFSAIPWNASWDAEVQSEVTDALNAYDPPTNTEMQTAFNALNDLSASDVWSAICETQGSIVCGDILALLLAESLGQADASGDTWTLSTPNGNAQRAVVTYG